MNSLDKKNLKKRYLIWFYKTTREALERVERKFTQVEMDKLILREFLLADKAKLFRKYVEDFAAYVQKKENEGLALKFEEDGSQKAEYAQMVAKFESVERTIRREFGSATLQEIRQMYEEEMTQRILKSAEH